MQLFIFSCHAKQLASESMGEVIDFSPQLSSLSFISRSYQLWTILNHEFIPSERFCIQIHSISHRIVRFIVSKHNSIFKRHWHSQRNLNEGLWNVSELGGKGGEGIIDAAGVRMWGTIDFKEESRDLTVLNFSCIRISSYWPEAISKLLLFSLIAADKKSWTNVFERRNHWALAYPCSCFSRLVGAACFVSCPNSAMNMQILMFMKIQYKVMKFA